MSKCVFRTTYILFSWDLHQSDRNACLPWMASHAFHEGSHKTVLTYRATLRCWAFLPFPLVFRTAVFGPHLAQDGNEGRLVLPRRLGSASIICP